MGKFTCDIRLIIKITEVMLFNMLIYYIQAVAPYERPALTKAYLFPHDKKPARLPVSLVYAVSGLSL